MKYRIWIALFLVCPSLAAQTSSAWERISITPVVSLLFPATYDSTAFEQLTVLSATEDSIQFNVSHTLYTDNWRYNIISEEELYDTYREQWFRQLAEADRSEMQDSVIYEDGNLIFARSTLRQQNGDERKYTYARHYLLNNELYTLTATCQEKVLGAATHRTIDLFFNSFTIADRDDVFQYVEPEIEVPESKLWSLLTWLLWAAGGIAIMLFIFHLLGRNYVEKEKIDSGEKSSK